jgi:hypothetical protein
MTKLVVEELKTTLIQEFTWNPVPRAHIAAVRPHLYTHGNPAGTFTLAILSAADVVLASQTFTAADLYFALDTGNAYAQLYFPVIFDNRVHLPKGNYKLRLSASGYSFSEASYLGWIRDHEDLKVPLDFTPASDLHNPLSYEIWVYK